MNLPWSSLITSTLSPGSTAVLFPWVAIALTVIAGPLHHRGLRARMGDARGMLVYFTVFFMFFAVVPCLVILAAETAPLAVLASLGMRVGNAALGLLICAAALPITFVLGLTVSREPAMREQYPFSKTACANDASFAAYEASYLLLYYTAWEFLYRGLLFFPLVGALGFPAAAAITTALSTVAHIGHPDSEIVGALAGGVIFSAIALLTGSILYPLIVHAMMGIGNDTLLYLRWHRGRRAAAQ
jgi:membrane protease YdiL (CAAX protease family)